MSKKGKIVTAGAILCIVLFGLTMKQSKATLFEPVSRGSVVYDINADGLNDVAIYANDMKTIINILERTEPDLLTLQRLFQ